MSGEVVDVLLAIAREASTLINEVYAAPFDVEFKSPGDPVTLADKRANDLICQRLSAAFPGVPIVAEESDPETFSGYRQAGRIFFVDPLDGTREFVARNGQFVTMIGLVEGDVATVGVIHAPAFGKSWVGAVGHGAWEISSDGTRQGIQVSATGALDAAQVVISRSHRTSAVETAVRKLGVKDVQPVGSAGLKGAHVACGIADAQVAPFYAGKRWDACAADALVTAAGGKYTDAAGLPFDYRSEDLGNSSGVLASNQLLHDALLAKLRSVRM